jgi:large subunit ribosomal protein L25
MLTLNAKIKRAEDSNDYLRAHGELPAVFYGFGNETTSITVPTIEFIKIFKEAGESTPVSLVTPNGAVNVLVHSVDVDPIRSNPIHVDFLVVDMKKKVQVTVPLTFDEVAPAAKAGLGVLVKVLHEIEIEALPADLPHFVHVSLSTLTGLDSSVTVADLVLPIGVIAITKDSEIVAAITSQVEEKEETTPVDLSSIEVEKKGKKEEESTPEESN